MNAKKAKAIRAQLRHEGFDPTDATTHETIPAKSRIGGHDHKGAPWYYSPPGTYELIPSCGRYRYKVRKVEAEMERS